MIRLWLCFMQPPVRLPKLCSKGSITITTLERYINVWHLITSMELKTANRLIRFLFINTTALCGAVVVEFFVFWHTMSNWIILCQTAQGSVPFEELSKAVGEMYIPALLMGLPFALLFSILWVEKMGAALGVPMRGYREWIRE